MKKYSKDDQKFLATWAADCAERVLPLFEKGYPLDDRPRKAIITCRNWVKTGVFEMSVIRGASLSAHAAARNVKNDIPAFNAARAAGHAVATAHVPQHAFGVFYALRAIAAAFPEEAEQKVLKEQAWQSRRIPEHLRPEYLKRIQIKKKKNGILISVFKDKDF